MISQERLVHQFGRDPPVEITPGGVSVEEQDRATLPLFHDVNTEAVVDLHHVSVKRDLFAEPTWKFRWRKPLNH